MGPLGGFEPPPPLFAYKGATGGHPRSSRGALPLSYAGIIGRVKGFFHHLYVPSSALPSCASKGAISLP